MRCQERESKGAGRSWLPPREAGSLVGGGNETRRHGWEEGGPRGRGRDEGLAEGAGLSYRTVQRGGLGRTARRFAAPARSPRSSSAWTGENVRELPILW